MGWYDNTSIISSGGLVSQWTDKSAAGNHWLASGSARPTDTASLLNGLHGLTFDGSANVMHISPFTLSGGTSINIFVVLRLNSAGVFPYLFSQDFEVFAVRGDSTTGKFSMLRNITTIETGSSIVGSWNKETILYSNAPLQQLWSQGVSQGSSSADSTAVAGGAGWEQNIYLGGRYNVTLFGQWDIAELIIYNTDQSANRIEIEGYLTQKWGV